MLADFGRGLTWHIKLVASLLALLLLTATSVHAENCRPISHDVKVEKVYRLDPGIDVASEQKKRRSQKSSDCREFSSETRSLLKSPVCPNWRRTVHVLTKRLCWQLVNVRLRS